MRNIIALITRYKVVAGGGGSPPTIRTVFANASLTSAASIGATGAVTSGDGLWVIVTSAGNVVPASVTDSNSNTGYSMIRSDFNASDSQTVSQWKNLNIASGSGTLTVTANFSPNAGGLGIAITPVFGHNQSGTWVGIGQVQSAPGAGADAVTSTALTPGSQPGLLLGFTCNTFSDTIASGTGFTDVVNGLTNWLAQTGFTTDIEKLNISSTSPVAATWTVSTNTGRDMSEAVFIPT